MKFELNNLTNILKIAAESEENSTLLKNMRGKLSEKYGSTYVLIPIGLGIDEAGNSVLSYRVVKLAKMEDIKYLSD